MLKLGKAGGVHTANTKTNIHNGIFKKKFIGPSSGSPRPIASCNIEEFYLIFQIKRALGLFFIL